MAPAVSHEVAIVFRVHAPLASSRDRVWLLGSSPELGEWNPAKAIETGQVDSEWKVWQATVRMPVNASFQWSWCFLTKDGRLRQWESSQKRARRISTCSGILHTAWADVEVEIFEQKLASAHLMTTRRTKKGDVVAVMGSSPGLGSWDPMQAVVAREFPPRSGHWTITVYYDAGTLLEWNWVIIDLKTRQVKLAEKHTTRFLFDTHGWIKLDVPWNKQEAIVDWAPKDSCGGGEEHPGTVQMLRNRRQRLQEIHHWEQRAQDSSQGDVVGSLRHRPLGQLNATLQLGSAPPPRPQLRREDSETDSFVEELPHGSCRTEPLPTSTLSDSVADEFKPILRIKPYIVGGPPQTTTRVRPPLPSPHASKGSESPQGKNTSKSIFSKRFSFSEKKSGSRQSVPEDVEVVDTGCLPTSRIFRTLGWGKSSSSPSSTPSDSMKAIPPLTPATPPMTPPNSEKSTGTIHISPKTSSTSSYKIPFSKEASNAIGRVKSAQSSPEKTIRDAEKLAPASPDRQAQSGFVREASSISTRERPPAPIKETPMTLTKEQHTVSAKESPTVTTKGQPSVSAKESPTVSGKASSTVSAKESSTVTTKGQPTVSAKESPTVTTKGQPSVSAKESPTVSAKASSTVSAKASSTVSAKASSTVSAKGKPNIVKEQPTAVSKEQLSAHSKEQLTAVETKKQPTGNLKGQPNIVNEKPPVWSKEQPTRSKEQPTVGSKEQENVQVKRQPTVMFKDAPEEEVKRQPMMLHREQSLLHVTEPPPPPSAPALDQVKPQRPPTTPTVPAKLEKKMSPSNVSVKSKSSIESLVPKDGHVPCSSDRIDNRAGYTPDPHSPVKGKGTRENLVSDPGRPGFGGDGSNALRMDSSEGKLRPSQDVRFSETSPPPQAPVSPSPPVITPRTGHDTKPLTRVDSSTSQGSAVGILGVVDVHKRSPSLESLRQLFQQREEARTTARLQGIRDRQQRNKTKFQQNQELAFVSPNVSDTACNKSPLQPAQRKLSTLSLPTVLQESTGKSEQRSASPTRRMTSPGGTPANETAWTPLKTAADGAVTARNTVSTVSATAPLTSAKSVAAGTVTSQKNFEAGSVTQFRTVDNMTALGSSPMSSTAHSPRGDSPGANKSLESGTRTSPPNYTSPLPRDDTSVANMSIEPRTRTSNTDTAPRHDISVAHMSPQPGTRTSPPRNAHPSPRQDPSEANISSEPATRTSTSITSTETPMPRSDPLLTSMPPEPAARTSPPRNVDPSPKHDPPVNMPSEPEARAQAIPKGSAAPVLFSSDYGYSNQGSSAPQEPSPIKVVTISSAFKDRIQRPTVTPQKVQVPPPMPYQLPIPCQSQQVPPPMPYQSQQIPPPMPYQSQQVPPPMPYQSQQAPPPMQYRSQQVPPPMPYQSQQVPPPMPYQSQQVPPPMPYQSQQVPPPMPYQSQQVPPPMPYQSQQVPPPMQYQSQNVPPSMQYQPQLVSPRMAYQPQSVPQRMPYQHGQSGPRQQDARYQQQTSPRPLTATYQESNPALANRPPGFSQSVSRPSRPAAGASSSVNRPGAQPSSPPVRTATMQENAWSPNLSSAQRLISSPRMTARNPEQSPPHPGAKKE